MILKLMYSIRVAIGLAHLRKTEQVDRGGSWTSTSSMNRLAFHNDNSNVKNLILIVHKTIIALERN